MRTRSSLWYTILRGFLARLAVSRRVHDAKISETHELYSNLTIHTSKSQNASAGVSTVDHGTRI